MTTDGLIEPLTDKGAQLIEICQLNRTTLVGFRRRLQVAVTALDAMDSVEAEAVLRDIMAFPDDLPDLRRLRPPANSRADGVDQSYFAQRERGELPEFYVA